MFLNDHSLLVLYTSNNNHNYDLYLIEALWFEEDICQLDFGYCFEQYYQVTILSVQGIAYIHSNKTQEYTILYAYQYAL